MSSDMYSLACSLGERMTRRNVMVASAESCTGGGISAMCTEVPGSSAWFDRAFVSYSNESKTQMLGVDAGLIERYGAVSEEVVLAMLDGALARSSASFAVSVSGIAGPSGGSDLKPVGTVCIAWGSQSERRVATYMFGGSRSEIRAETVKQSLKNLIHLSDVTV